MFDIRCLKKRIDMIVFKLILKYSNSCVPLMWVFTFHIILYMCILKLQVNHLGHFLLTLELLPLLLSTAEVCGDCRVAFVASRRHVHGVLDPSNMNGEVSYSRYGFYNNSKLYNVSLCNYCMPLSCMQCLCSITVYMFIFSCMYTHNYYIQSMCIHILEEMYI